MPSDRGAQIMEQARGMGAAMAGIANVELLKRSPSHQILGTFGTKIEGVHSFEGIEDFNRVRWPAGAKSVLVIALSHPRDRPELD
jgi:epoxyqueuosine reductase